MRPHREGFSGRWGGPLGLPRIVRRRDAGAAGLPILALWPGAVCLVLSVDLGVGL